MEELGDDEQESAPEADEKANEESLKDDDEGEQKTALQADEEVTNNFHQNHGI